MAHTVTISQEALQAQREICQQIQFYWQSRRQEPLAWVDTMAASRTKTTPSASAACWPSAAMA